MLTTPVPDIQETYRGNPVPPPGPAWGDGTTSRGSEKNDPLLVIDHEAAARRIADDAFERHVDRVGKDDATPASGPGSTP
jgi:hypothetical protein